MKMRDWRFILFVMSLMAETNKHKKKMTVVEMHVVKSSKEAKLLGRPTRVKMI